MNSFRNFNGFSGILSVSCKGEDRNRVGGLSLLWKEGVEVEVMSFSLHRIDFLISLQEGEEKWRCSGIYGYPESHDKHKTCELIDHLATTNNTSKWLLFGDFNLILSQDEKEGGNFGNSSIISLF